MNIKANSFFPTQDGAHLYYEDVGSGIPIILVPGFMCTTKFFRNNIPELSKYYRVISFDPRGYGRSSKTLQGNNIKQHAYDIKDLIDYLKLKDVVLIGWSLAGSSVVSYSKIFNDYNLKAIGLLDPPLHPFSDEEWNLHGVRNYNVDAWQKAYSVWITDPDVYYNNFCSRIFNGPISPVDEAWIKSEVYKTMPWAGIELHMDYCHTNNVENLKDITVPVIIYSSKSESYGLAMGEKYASEINTYCELHKFYEGGHMLFYVEHEKFNQCTIQFIKNISK